MSTCEMPDRRDRLVWDAVERAREGDAVGAQKLLDRAARAWPVEPAQLRRVQRALEEAGTSAPLENPNRVR